MLLIENLFQLVLNHPKLKWNFLSIKLFERPSQGWVLEMKVPQSIDFC